MHQYLLPTLKIPDIVIHIKALVGLTHEKKTPKTTTTKHLTAAAIVSGMCFRSVGCLDCSDSSLKLLVD